jgi:hypothetical protein
MKFLIVFALLPLVGCGAVQRMYTHYTGDMTVKCSPANTVYVQSDSGLAPLFDINGKTVGCR